MYCTGVREGKMEKEAKINHSILVFFPTIYSRCIQNLKTLAVIGAENSMTKSFIGEKEKWTNKRKDKQQHADSLLHSTTIHN